MNILRGKKGKLQEENFLSGKQSLRLNYNYKCGSFQLIQIVLYADPKEKKIHEMMGF